VKSVSVTQFTKDAGSGCLGSLGPVEFFKRDWVGLAGSWLLPSVCDRINGSRSSVFVSCFVGSFPLSLLDVLFQLSVGGFLLVLFLFKLFLNLL